MAVRIRADRAEVAVAVAADRKDLGANRAGVAADRNDLGDDDDRAEEAADRNDHDDDAPANRL